MALCEAHDMMTAELGRMKNAQADLYALDRKRADTMAEIQKDIAILKTDSRHTKDAVEEIRADISGMRGEINTLKQDVKTDMGGVKRNITELGGEVAGMSAVLDEVKKTLQQKKWTPRDYCVIIAAALALAGSVLGVVLGR